MKWLFTLAWKRFEENGRGATKLSYKENAPSDHEGFYRVWGKRNKRIRSIYIVILGQCYGCAHVDIV